MARSLVAGSAMDGSQPSTSTDALLHASLMEEGQRVRELTSLVQQEQRKVRVCHHRALMCLANLRPSSAGQPLAYYTADTRRQHLATLRGGQGSIGGAWAAPARREGRIGAAGLKLEVLASIAEF